LFEYPQSYIAMKENYKRWGKYIFKTFIILYCNHTVSISSGFVQDL